MVLRTAVRAHIVVGNIGEFLHGLVHLFLRPKFVQIYTFVLQSVEVPLHRRIVIWISGFLHVPSHMGRFAKLFTYTGFPGHCVGSDYRLPDAGIPMLSAACGPQVRW